MALHKIILQDNGTICSYHKVTDIHCSTLENNEVQLAVTLCSYVDKDIRDKSQDLSVVGKGYHFTLPSTILENQSIFTVAYNQIKTLPQFAEAEDC